MNFDSSMLIVIVIIIIIGYTVLHCSCKNSEGFASNKVLDSTNQQVNPKLYNPELNASIDESGIVGLPTKLVPAWEQNTKQYGEVDILDDGMNGNAGLNFNMCSKSCCSKQYPTPFDLPTDPLVCNSEQEFVPSSYTCNNAWQDSGCVCMTKDQSLFLNKRGNNA